MSVQPEPQQPRDNTVPAKPSVLNVSLPTSRQIFPNLTAVTHSSGRLRLRELLDLQNFPPLDTDTSHVISKNRKLSGEGAPASSPAPRYMSQRQAVAELADLISALNGGGTEPNRQGALRDLISTYIHHQAQKDVPLAIEDVAEVIKPEGLDLPTLKYLELEKIWEPMFNRSGTLGRLAISQSLLRPCRSEVVITAKQDAYREVLENTQTRQQLEQLVDTFNKSWEDSLIRTHKRGMDFSGGYSEYWSTRESLLGLVALAERLAPSSDYVSLLRDDILALKETELYQLLKKGIVKTATGIKPPAEAKGQGLRSRFLPWDVTPFLALAGTPFVTGALMALYHLPWGSNLLGSAILALGIGAAVPIGIAKAIDFKHGLDHQNVATPLSNIATADHTLAKALRAVGRLGELVAGVEFIDRAKVPLEFPEVVEASHHYFVGAALHSPLFFDDPSYVSSDISIFDKGITCITGPNSGGKTTVARALLLSQILAQAGLPLALLDGKIAVAEQIAYQTPETNSQEASEGRFGTELARSRDITFSAGPRSFCVLDELAEGTTLEEKERYSRGILESHNLKGSSTILITHNLELAHMFKNLGIGSYLQVEFKDGNPTHRLIPGVSTSSQADRVAQKIGFSLDDIREDLRRGGYLQHGLEDGELEHEGLDKGAAGGTN